MFLFFSLSFLGTESISPNRPLTPLFDALTVRDHILTGYCEAIITLT